MESVEANTLIVKSMTELLVISLLWSLRSERRYSIPPSIFMHDFVLLVVLLATNCVA